MLAAYGKEKQNIIDRYVRLKPWYEGELQRRIRDPNIYDNISDPYHTEVVPRTEPDPINDRGNWSGALFWESCLNTELNKLNLAYEKYFPKEDDKVKYTWIGINPD